MLDGLLGETNEQELTKSINRMGGQFISRDSKEIKLAMPRWRFDILHPVDLVEDIAMDMVSKI